MITVGEFISDVKNTVKANTKDDRISSRYIHRLAKDYTSYLLSQRNLSDIMRDFSIFTEITCVEMVQVRADICDIAEFRKCDLVMKSKCKLPELFNSLIGPMVISVTNMTGEVEYEHLRSPSDLTNARKRKFNTTTKYWYILNRDLYIVGATPARVSIVGLFADELEAIQASSCNSKEELDECESAYDYKMVIPNKFISTVKDQVIQRILTRKQIPGDELPNLDSNIKTNAQNRV